MYPKDLEYSIYSLIIWWEEGRKKGRKAPQPCKEGEPEAIFGSEYLKYTYNGWKCF